MPKRKSGADERVPSKSFVEVDAEDDVDEDDMSMLDVDFEFYDPEPSVDFHGLKSLLRQLFDVDSQLFDLSELVNLILSQSHVGTTVKCEGLESDPYAIVTVLNTHYHRETAIMKHVRDYLASKASKQQGGLQQLEALLSADSKAQVGLVLSERFINMPHQIVPPMYTCLLDDVSSALEDSEPFDVTHYLVISKTYTEEASALDTQDDPPQKKKMKKKQVANGSRHDLFYFHPEDEVFQQNALAYAGFDYSRSGDEVVSDSKRTFQELGVRPRGHLILLEVAKFKDAVKSIGDYLGEDR